MTLANWSDTVLTESRRTIVAGCHTVAAKGQLNPALACSGHQIKEASATIKHYVFCRKGPQAKE